MTTAKPSRRRPLIIVLAAVLGLCLIMCVVAFIINPPGSPPASSSDAVAGVTEPPRATATLAPTRTPRPTRTPVPTVVSSRSIGNDKECYFEQAHKPAAGVDVVRTNAKRLLPTDAQFIRSYHPEAVPQLTVDLYNSAWLKQQYPNERWLGGEAGDFIVIYGPSPTAVSRVVIACGNWP